MTTSVPPDDNSGNNNRRINVGRVDVERMSVDKSEIKSAEVDILIALSQATIDQTETIQSSNEDIAKQLKKLVEGKGASANDLQKVIDALDKGFAELIPAINRSAAATDENANAANLSSAEMRRTQRVHEALNKEGETLREVIINLQDVERVVNQNFLEPARQFGAVILKTISNVTRLNTAIDYSIDRFNDSLDLAGAGLVDFSDIYIEPFKKLLHPFKNAGDDIIETGKLIRGSLQEGLVSPLSLIGGNINDVARSFGKFRKDLEDVEGLDMDAFSTFQEQNKMAAEFLQSQRRMGIKDDLNTTAMRNSFSSQQEFLQVIAANTGKTVAELAKEVAVEAKTFTELKNMGVFTKEQTEKLILIDNSLKSRGNEAASDFIRKIAESRGDIGAFKQIDSATFEMLQRLKMTDVIGKVFEAEKRGDTDEIERLAIQVGNAWDRFNKLGGISAIRQVRGTESGGAESAFRALSAETKTLVALNEDQVKKDVVKEYYDKFKDWTTNVFPTAAAAALAATITNTGALVGLTIATIAAMRKTGLMATMGSLSKSGIGMIGGLASRALPVVAAGAGVLSTGKDLIDLASGDTSASNNGALAGSAIGGTMGAIVGSIFPGIGTVMGGMAGAAVGNYIGEMIGSSMEDDDISKTMTPAIESSPALSSTGTLSTSANRSSTIGEKTLTATEKQNILLTDIRESMNEANRINRSNGDKLGSSPGSYIGPKGRDASKATSGTGVVQTRLGVAD